MLKTFPIDFIRQALEQKLLEEHLKNVNYYGGKNQVSILSFYEQLKSQDEVDRFVETYRDLADQQNRTGLILNGVLVSAENPTITNLYSSLIVPMSFTCSMRCKLADRDQGIITINNLIENLKGRKVDIAQLNCVDENERPYSTPFMVGTLGQNDGEPTLKNGDYVGSVNSVNEISDNLLAYFDVLELSQNETQYVYCENENQLKVAEIYKDEPFVSAATTVLNHVTDSNDYILYVNAKLRGSLQHSNLTPLYNEGTGVVELIMDNDTSYEVPCSVEITNYEIVNGYPEITVKMTLKQRYRDDDLEEIVVNSCDIYYKGYRFIVDDGNYNDIVFPPEHTSFEKYKLSFSFDAIRCDEPRNLNGEEYCELSFGGSCTLVSEGVKLGNDLLKIKVSKVGIKGTPNITFSENATYLEPLEMPSGNNANTQINQLVSNVFKVGSHTDSIALTLQYTFICDMKIPLIKQWYNYARYGTQGLTVNDISPNISYNVTEYSCSWGDFEKTTVQAKINESIDIENTESDTMTISIVMQIQGDVI